MKEFISSYLPSDQEVRDASCDGLECEGRVKEVHIKAAIVYCDLSIMNRDDGHVWIVGGRPWHYDNGLFVKSRCPVCGQQDIAFRRGGEVDLDFQIGPHFEAKI